MTLLISYLFGCFSKITRPRFLARAIIFIFKRLFKINLLNSKKEKETDFKSLYELFTREVKEREIKSEFIHPVDGKLVSFGQIKNGQTFLIKGKNYSVKELVGQDTESLEGYYFYNYYLSPKDYHRVHHFTSGVYKRAYEVKGALYPVAPWFVKLVPSVFAKNYRTVSVVENDKGSFYQIMVGALNVGSIELVRGLFTYSDKSVKVGEHLGTFALGSSVVLISPVAFDVKEGAVSFTDKLSVK